MARDRERAEVRERDADYYAGREPAGDYVADEPERRRTRGGGGGDRTLLWALALLAAGFLVWAIWATWFQSQGAQSAGPGLGITLNDVGDNPSELYGSTVVLSGAVQGGSNQGDGGGVFGDEGVTQQFGQNAFVLGGGSGQASVLVVGSDLAQQIGTQFGGGDGELFGGDGGGLISDVLAGDVIQVTGTLQQFNLNEFEQQLGFDFGDAGAFQQWQGQPAIMADQVSLIPRPQAEQQEVANVTASALSDNPSEFFQTRVQIDEATIGNVISDNAFELGLGNGDGGNNVIVLTAGGQQLQQGQTVNIQGIVTEASTARIATMFGVQTQDGGGDGGFFSQSFGVDPQDFERYDAAILSGFRPVQPGTTGG